MNSVNTWNDLLYFDFHFKAKWCCACTQHTETVAHSKRMKKACGRIEAKISLNAFTHRIYFPDSTRAELFNELELKRRSPYQTRHIVGTLWLAADEPPEWLARQMQHNTIEMLFRGCSGHMPNLMHKDESAFEPLLQNNLDQEISHE